MTYESKILNVTLRRAKIHFVPDVVYAQVPTFEKPNQLLQMDLLIPQVEKKLPAVIFVTGGGLIAANRARMPQLRMHLAEKNFVVASINYRTAPNAKFPQPIEDVKAAIRFLKANAQKFNVDAEQANLINYITKNSAPMLLMHGTADNIVPPAQTELLFQALKNHGVVAQRYLVPNASHADDYWQQDEVFALITEFLTAHL